MDKNRGIEGNSSMNRNKSGRRHVEDLGQVMLQEAV